MGRRPSVIATGPSRDETDQLLKMLARQPILVLETTGFLERPDGRFERLPLARRCELLLKEPARIKQVFGFDPKSGAKVPVRAETFARALAEDLVRIVPRIGDHKPRAYTTDFIRANLTQFESA